jgi:molybdate transport system ATP-binding protein
VWVAGRPEQSDDLRLRIRANDVSLCRKRPEDTTILNVLAAEIEDIQPDSGSSVLVRLIVGDDRLIARITKRSCNELSLRAGDQIFAQIKSVAVRNVPQFETALPQ